jgi:hypothetical protein
MIRRPRMGWPSACGPHVLGRAFPQWHIASLQPQPPSRLPAGPVAERSHRCGFAPRRLVVSGADLGTGADAESASSVGPPCYRAADPPTPTR